MKVRLIPVLLILTLFFQCKKPNSPEDTPRICTAGAGSVNALMDAWIHGLPSAPEGMFHEGRGNETVAEVLLEGRCRMGVMTFPMKDRQVDLFVQKFGTPPVAIPVAAEALAIIASPDLKIDSIQMDRIKALFTAPDPSTVIDSVKTIYGVNSASDRYRWFKTRALGGADFSDTVIELPGPGSLGEMLAHSKNSLGYARPQEVPEGVSILSLQDEKTGKTISPNPESIQSGTYPLSRYVYIYTLPDRNGPLDLNTVAFLREVLSDSGQQILPHYGYVPLSKSDRTRSLRLIDR